MQHNDHRKEILSHDSIIDLFLTSYNANRMHHAWLFSGIRGIGKEFLTTHIAKFLLERKTFTPTTDFSYNDQISSQVDNKSAPDLFFLDGSDGIKIADIHKVINFLSMTPIQSMYKVVIITCIENMNVSASNALLKSLEEPEGNTVLLMTTNSLGTLLPTIRSRCSICQLSPLDFDSFSNVLKKNDITTDEGLYQICSGSPGIAIDYVKHDLLKTHALISDAIATKDASKLISSDSLSNLSWPTIRELVYSVLHENILEAGALERVQHVDDAMDVIMKAETYNLDKLHTLLVIVHRYGS